MINSSQRHGEAWQKKFDNIREVAIELFLRDGENMSMRELAKRLNIAVSGMYRYIHDKRDLFFLCQNYLFEKLTEDFERIAMDNFDDLYTTLYKIGDHLLDIAEFNFSLFKFLFMLEPPPSNKEKGPEEIKCQRLAIDGLKGLLIMGIKQSKINLNIDEVDMFAKILWGIILGPGIIISPMYDYFFESEELEWKKKYRKNVLELALKQLI